MTKTEVLDLLKLNRDERTYRDCWRKNCHPEFDAFHGVVEHPGRLIWPRI